MKNTVGNMTRKKRQEGRERGPRQPEGRRNSSPGGLRAEEAWEVDDDEEKEEKEGK